VLQAVDEGILAISALAVPYGNLATMYEALGQKDEAAKYAELAKSSNPPKAPTITQASAKTPPRTAANTQRRKPQPVPRSFSNQAAAEQRRRIQQQQRQRQNSAEKQGPQRTTQRSAQNGPRPLY
jgi:hypothetical protein